MTDPEGLRRATDEMNVAFTLFEEALKDLNLGVSCSVVMDESTRLEFRKSGNTFRLMIVSVSEDHREVAASPIINTSRLTRLRAVNFLLALERKLVQEHQRQLDQTSKAPERILARVKAIRAGRIGKE